MRQADQQQLQLLLLHRPASLPPLPTPPSCSCCFGWRASHHGPSIPYLPLHQPLPLSPAGPGLRSRPTPCATSLDPTRAPPACAAACFFGEYHLGQLLESSRRRRPGCRSRRLSLLGCQASDLAGTGRRRPASRQPSPVRCRASLPYFFSLSPSQPSAARWPGTTSIARRHGHGLLLLLLLMHLPTPQPLTSAATNSAAAWCCTPP